MLMMLPLIASAAIEVDGIYYNVNDKAQRLGDKSIDKRITIFRMYNGQTHKIIRK